MVDDDPATQRGLVRVARDLGDCVRADSFKRAAALLDDSSQWTAFPLDVELGN